MFKFEIISQNQNVHDSRLVWFKYFVEENRGKNQNERERQIPNEECVVYFDQGLPHYPQQHLKYFISLLIVFTTYKRNSKNKKAIWKIRSICIQNIHAHTYKIQFGNLN